MRVELVVRHHDTDESHRGGLVGVDLGGGEDEVARPRQPDGIHQARRHVGVGEPAQQLGEPEPGAVGRDAHVTVQGEVDPARVARGR